MGFHFGFKEAVIGFMFDGREVNEIGLFELVADAGPEFLEIVLTDLLLIFGLDVKNFGVRFFN